MVLDPFISRKHAILKVLVNQDVRYFYIEDTGSRNGTLVNGNIIKNPTRLHHGDIIAIGRTTMEFVKSDPTYS